MTPLEFMAAHGGLKGDPALIGFSLRNRLYSHRRFAETVSRLAELHQYSLTKEVSSGLLLTGPSGVGKSTVIEYYQNGFPRQTGSGGTRIPVLTVATPTAPTVKSLAQAILVALGDSGAHRGSAEEKTQRIYYFLQRCAVEMVFLDEFHHCFYANTGAHFRHVSDWLKGLMNVTKVALVLVGMPEGAAVIRSNSQLVRRINAHINLSPFELEDKADFDEFRGLLRTFESALPLPVAVPLHEGNLARRFHLGSDGRLDYIRKILEGAVSVATRAGIPELDLPVYASAFRLQVWAEVPDRLNPFHPDSHQRPLSRPGEPFESGSYSGLIGSPVARRLGLVTGCKGGAHA